MEVKKVKMARRRNQEAPRHVRLDGRLYTLNDNAPITPEESADIHDAVSDPRYARANRRIGSRLLDGREPAGEAAIVVGLGSQLFRITFPNMFEHLYSAGTSARQAYETVSDAVKGGPQGMRGAKSLDEAIRALEEASSVNREAARTLNQYTAARKEFVQALLRTYEDNETTARVLQRAEVQLKASAKSALDAGNSIKPGILWEIYDKPIIVAYATAKRNLGDPLYAKARNNDELVSIALEHSDNMRKFYDETRKFYNERQKAEETVNAFTSYLQKTMADTQQKNQELERLYPKVIEMVKKGYSVEDIIFEMDRKNLAITKEDVQKTATSVGEHQSTVEGTRTEVGKVTPLPEQGIDYIGIVTNPFVITAALYVVAKGIRATLLPRFIDNGISRLVVSPVKQGLNGAHWMYDTVIDRYGARRLPGGN